MMMLYVLPVTNMMLLVSRSMIRWICNCQMWDLVQVQDAETGIKAMDRYQ